MSWVPWVPQAPRDQHQTLPSSDAEHPQLVPSQGRRACWGDRAVGATTMLFPKNSSPDPPTPPPGAAPMGTYSIPWESPQWEGEMYFTVSPQREKNLGGSSGGSPKAAGDILSQGECCGHGPRGWRVAAGAALISPAPSSRQCGWIYCPRLLPPAYSCPAGQIPSVPYPAGQRARGQQISPCTRAQPTLLILQPLPRGSHGETEARENHRQQMGQH